MSGLKFALVNIIQQAEPHNGREYNGLNIGCMCAFFRARIELAGH
jgi:hypothetical protein